MNQVNAQVTEVAWYNEEVFVVWHKEEIAQLLETTIGTGASDVIAASIAQNMHGGIYLVTWHGQKTPTGATVWWKEISWAQSGVLYWWKEKGIIGTYERFEDPTDALAQKMLIRLKYNG